MEFFYQTQENEIRFAEESSCAYPPHLHLQAEVVFVLKGSTVCFVDEKEYRLCAGDSVIIYPNKIHSYREDNNVTVVLMIINPMDFPNLKAMFNGMEPICPVIRKEQLEKIGFYDTVKFAFEEFCLGNNAVKKGSALMVLGKLLPLLNLQEKNRGDNNIINEILSFCENNYKEPITLSDTAEAMHISNGYLSHIFSDRLRISFSDYINRLRINDACLLLKNSKSTVTEISNICGFNSLRTFNRAFLKYTGTTPSKYRRM